MNTCVVLDAFFTPAQFTVTLATKTSPWGRPASEGQLTLNYVRIAQTLNQRCTTCYLQLPYLPTMTLGHPPNGAQ